MPVYKFSQSSFFITVAPADRALEIGRTLRRIHRIQVPVFPWDDRSWVRISGFAGYNQPGDYSRLAQVLPEVASS